MQAKLTELLGKASGLSRLAVAEEFFHLWLIARHHHCHVAARVALDFLKNRVQHLWRTLHGMTSQQRICANVYYSSAYVHICTLQPHIIN